MRNLSKSKILSYRQCAKKLWLEVNRRELGEYSKSSEKGFDIGNEVGDVARNIYDPQGSGTLIDPSAYGFRAAFKKTAELLEGDKPIFEAAFSIEGGLALADVMLRLEPDKAWRMIEVKSSTSVKDYHLDDISIQNYVAKKSGVNLEGIALGHINSKWIYNGDRDYSGLIKEVDLTAHAKEMEQEVAKWFKAANKIASQSVEPDVEIGSHCSEPFECPFIGYCSKDKPKAKFPVTWLPRIQKKALKKFIQENDTIEIEDIPDELLNEKQLRVKESTLRNAVYFDRSSSNEILKKYDYPLYYLDFETINFAVPKWKGTRPYQQIPFQFSLHYCVHPTEDEQHIEFLDLSGNDPSYPFASALINGCGNKGPIFVYNIAFESTRLKELAYRFEDLKDGLMAINQRLVDLWPIAKEYYYHPSQQGSWSIKAVLPAMSPKHNYDALEGVKDGRMAMDAYAKAIHPETDVEEKKLIEQQLLKYCELDTRAMVEIFEFLTIGPAEYLGTPQDVINRQTFELEEIQHYFSELALDKTIYRNEFEKLSMVAGKIFDHDAERCLSMIYRIRALSEMIQNKKLPGWSKLQYGSQVDVHFNILRAVGQCEMIEVDDRFRFDSDELLSVAFEYGKPI